MKNLHLIVIAYFITICSGSFAQILTIESVVTPEMTVNGQSELFEIIIENNTTTIQNGSIALDFPNGIRYVEASLQNLGDGNVSFTGTTEIPVFNFTSLGGNEKLRFAINQQAVCSSIDEQLSGIVFRNELDVTVNSVVENHISSPYNILYASLSILSVTPKNASVISGAKYTQEIKIINGGNGKIEDFELDLNLPTELVLISTDIGTIVKDKIMLNSTEISTIGNMDNYLDQDEIMLINVTLSGISCSDKTVTSTYSTGWSDASGYCQNAETYSNVAIDFDDPHLVMTSNSNLNTCFTTKSSLQELVIENTGNGVASAIAVDIFKSSGLDYDQDLLSEFDVTSIQYRIGTTGDFISISPDSSTETRNDGVYSCLGSSPKGQFIVNLPSIESNERLYLQWDMNSCLSGDCDELKMGGWEADLTYSDACSIANLSASLVGQDPFGVSMTVFTESNPDITDGEEGIFTYMIDSYENTFPIETGASFVVNFNIPEGLDFENNSNITWSSSTIDWTATNIVYDNNTRTLAATFELPEKFLIPKSEINLILRGNCSVATAGTKNMDMSIDYNINPSCSSSLPMICSEDLDVVLRCPSSDCDAGILFTSYEMKRVSYGLADNNDDGLADVSGILNLNKIKTNRVMTGDTMQSVFEGTVRTNTQYTSWDHAYVQTVFPLGVNLSALYANVTFQDVSSGLTHKAVTVISTNLESSTATFITDISPGTLVVNGNNNFTGLTYDDGDILNIEVFYEMEQNIGATVIEVTTINDFYASDIANPINNNNKFQCDNFFENITLIGYEFSIVKQDYVTFKSCDKKISQTFRLSIGNCCSNFNGGNLFPYEYRNWASIKEAKVVIPANYTVLNTNFFHYRTSGTNGTSTESVTNITADAINGREFYFDLSQYLKSLINTPDDGFTGKLELKLKANCDVPIKTYENLDWSFNLTKTSFLDGTSETGYINIAPDRIRYNPTLVKISSSNPVEDGISKYVVWNVRVKNPFSGGGIDNVFLHFDSPTGDIIIDRIVDVSDDSELSVQNDLYVINSMTSGETKNYKVYARYSTCSPEIIYARVGYACDALPVNFSSFTCPTAAIVLKVEPKPSQLQVQVNSSMMEDICSPFVEVDIQFASVQLGAVDSIELVMNIPQSQSILYLEGSAEKLYPLTDSWESFSDPILQSNKYSVWLHYIETKIEGSALPGVYFTDKNKLNMRFTLEMQSNFVPGDHVLFNINSERICDEDLPTINVAFDPNMKFEKTEIVGLTDVAGDSWSVSWVDYNNDGNEDVFITDYQKDVVNALYTNMGDGTFQKYSIGSLSTDLASSLASTWGDYDNDGDEDLFVANNLGNNNFLYNNNGDGTFTKITEGEIVNYDGYSHGASWVDYDLDGFLDLFVTDFMATKHNVLYRNNGDGTFERDLTIGIVMESAKSLTPVWGDMDGDRDQDLFVPNYEGNNFLYRNDGNGSFTLMSSSAVMERVGNSTGASWGDINNDGDLDLYVTYASASENEFFINDGSGEFTKVNSVISNFKGDSHGSVFADFDSDGDLDLFVSNDASTKNRFFTNMGEGVFMEFATDIDLDLENSFGTATGDMDNDGDVDLFVANHSEEKNSLYVNQKAACQSNVCVNLVGVESNQSAIGARVFVIANIYGQTITQMKELNGQTGAGGQNSSKLLFGLGNASGVEKIVVQWPSGITQIILNQPINDCYTIVETSGSLLTGIAYNDENNNCIRDKGEVVLANQSIEIVEKGMILKTDSLGVYKIYVEDGNYTIKGSSAGNWGINCSQQVVAVLGSGVNIYENINFGFYPKCLDPNIELTMGTTAMRRGFSNDLIINVTNNGGSMLGYGRLELELPFGITPLGSNVDWSDYSNGVVSWDIKDLNVNDVFHLIIKDTLDLSMQTGDALDFELRFNTTEQQCPTTNNLLSHTEVVVGAIDPNEKHVYPMNNERGVTYVHQQLTYKILFENEGTYYATNVIIIDTLDESLDLNSLRHMVASHGFTYQLNGRVLTVKFSNIMLPATMNDSLKSQGFVQFVINPLDNLEEGVSVNNTANIIFDFEDPIKTNQVTNSMTQHEFLPMAGELGFTVFPLPIKDVFTISLENNGEQIDQVTIYSLDSKEVFHQENIYLNTLSLDKMEKLVGMYILKVTTTSGQFDQRKIVFE